MALEALELAGELLRAAEQALGAKHTVAALVLIYATIDIMGSLERAKDEGTRKAFVRWADAYLLPRDELPCTALELFAARCGVLHTLTANADLTRQGRARRILYSWGTARAEDLREISRRLKKDVVGIHIGDLRTAVEQAILRYRRDLEANPARAAAVQQQLSQWFTFLPVETARAFLEKTGGKPAT
jgi:hypothetical protein